MMKLGIAWIVISIIFLPISLLAAILGLGTIASVAFTLAKIVALLFIPGIVLVVIAALRPGRGRAA